MLFLNSFYHLLLDAAPWLLAGLMIAGLIQSFVPSQALAKHLGQDSLGANIKAALFGAPLPLCSCSVIPAAISLRRSGASRSATVSFLVSTPETGADSIAVSYALLGPFMAIIRPIAAIVSAITAGLLTIALPEKLKTATTPEPVKSHCQSQCGCSHQASSVPQNQTTDHQAHAHHHHHAEQPPTADTLFNRFWQGQRYAFVDIFNDMAGWLMVGLLLAAATLAWLPHNFLTQWGGGFIAMLVMALVGVPMYICATASTPIAASLLIAGISPGAVLVFLLAGPATNMATIGVVKRELGQRAVIAYLIGVLSVAFIFGGLTNLLVDFWHIDIQAQLAASQDLLPEWLMLGSAFVLVLLFLNYARQTLRPKALI